MMWAVADLVVREVQRYSGNGVSGDCEAGSSQLETMRLESAQSDVNVLCGMGTSEIERCLQWSKGQRDGAGL